MYTFDNPTAIPNKCSQTGTYIYKNQTILILLWTDGAKTMSSLS